MKNPEYGVKMLPKKGIQDAPDRLAPSQCVQKLPHPRERHACVAGDPDLADQLRLLHRVVPVLVELGNLDRLVVASHPPAKVAKPFRSLFHLPNCSQDGYWSLLVPLPHRVVPHEGLDQLSVNPA